MCAGLLNSLLPLQMSIAHAAFTVSARWAAWCPLANLTQMDHNIQLLGGPSINPDSTFTFVSASGEAIGSSASLSTLSGGALSFSFSTVKKVSQDLSTITIIYLNIFALYCQRFTHGPSVYTQSFSF